MAFSPTLRRQIPSGLLNHLKPQTLTRNYFKANIQVTRLISTTHAPCDNNVLTNHKVYCRTTPKPCHNNVGTNHNAYLSTAATPRHNNVWTNQKADLHLPDDVDVARFALELMGKHGNRTAMTDGLTGETLTYSDMQTQICCVASALAKDGVRPGDVVSLLLPNCVQYPLIFLAITAIGAVACPLNPVYTPGELNVVLKQSRSKYVFTTPGLTSTVKQACRGDMQLQRVYSVGSSDGCRPYSDLVSDDGSAFPVHLDILPREHVAALPYSSGTTGLPKGVMLSHYNIIANVQQMTHPSLVECLSSEGTILGLLPFFHIYGLVNILMNHIKRGAHIISLPRFEPQSFLRCIQDCRMDFLHLVPPLVLFLAKHPSVPDYDVSSVRRIMVGAAPIGGDVVEEAKHRIGGIQIGQGYGMTESSPLTHLNQEEEITNMAAVGQVIPQTEFRVVDLASGSALPPFEAGEIWSRGPQVMLGYLNNPEATASTVTEEGWLRSGDIGYADEDGYLYVTDRLKELIKVKGNQVAPAELEALLVTHPAVTDAAVIGVADERSGELPRAFVVKRNDIACTEQDIQNFVADHVAPYKKLDGGVVFVDAIPKTASGKILRRNLR